MVNDLNYMGLGVEAHSIFHHTLPEGLSLGFYGNAHRPRVTAIEMVTIESMDLILSEARDLGSKLEHLHDAGGSREVGPGKASKKELPVVLAGRKAHSL